MAANIRKAAPLLESAAVKATTQAARTPFANKTERAARSIKTQASSRQAMALNAFTHEATFMPDVAPAPRKEYKYLRNLVGSLPFIFETPKEAESAPQEFKFPLGTLFKAPTREMGLELKDLYAVALREHGMAGIELGFDDPNSQFVLDLVEAMGCTADTHSGNQGALWDVKYKPEGVPNLAKGGNATAHSVSHSLGEFAWHTDGAFEVEPQRYFGFHIMHPDKQGGGVFRLLKGEEIVDMLSPEAAAKLANTTFDLKVPDEFYKGVDKTRGKVLEVDPTTGHVLVRFRADILFDPPSSDPEANAAIGELTQLLSSTDGSNGVGKSVPNYVFKENTVLLVDNKRFLHSRTDIKDPKRWIRRVRFNGEPGAEQEQTKITA